MYKNKNKNYGLSLNLAKAAFLIASLSAPFTLPDAWNVDLLLFVPPNTSSI